MSDKQIDESKPVERMTVQEMLELTAKAAQVHAENHRAMAVSQAIVEGFAQSRFQTQCHIQIAINKAREEMP